MVGRETLGHCMLLPACTTGTQGSSPWDRANGTHNNQEGKLFAFVMSLHSPLVTKLDLSYHLIKIFTGPSSMFTERAMKDEYGTEWK